ncbi:hypothetical protein NC652_041665 [Populus alba x Populus x berolinensis]|nr:hypothetical protein NC652_041665 [Populus alba x Populus x berolinensis]
MHVKRCKQINKIRSIEPKESDQISNLMEVVADFEKLDPCTVMNPPHRTQESFTLHAWYICLLFIYLAFLLG